MHLCIFTFLIFKWYFWILQFFFSANIFERTRYKCTRDFSGSKYNKEYCHGCYHQQKVYLMPSVGISPPQPSAQIAMRYSFPLGKTLVIPLLKACGILFADGNNHDSIFLIAFATRKSILHFYFALSNTFPK